MWIRKSGYPKVDTPKQLKFLSFSKHIHIYKCGYPKVDTPKQLKFLSFSKHILIYKCGYPNVDTQKWIPKKWIHQNNSNSSAFQNIYTVK